MDKPTLLAQAKRDFVARLQRIPKLLENRQRLHDIGKLWATEQQGRVYFIDDTEPYYIYLKLNDSDTMAQCIMFTERLVDELNQHTAPCAIDRGDAASLLRLRLPALDASIVFTAAANGSCRVVMCEETQVVKRKKVVCDE